MSRRKNKKCLDCGKLICQVSKRCFRCAMKDPKLCRKRSEATKARWAHGVYDGRDDNPETKRKKSRAAKVRWENPEYRHKVSKSMKAAHARGDFDNPETKHRKSEAMKAAWARGDYGPEWRRKNAEAIKAKWERGDYDSPEYRRKTSEGIKAAHARGNYDNPETKRKMSESMKAAWACGDYGTPEWRRKNAEAIRAKWERGDYDGVVFCRAPYKSTEVPVAIALDAIGISHVSQYYPDGCRFIFDEFIPPNALIEVHGDYWHSTEKAQKRDVEKATWAKENGYHLVVIWEHELHELAKAIPIRLEVALVCAAIQLVRGRIGDKQWK